MIIKQTQAWISKNIKTCDSLYLIMSNLINNSSKKRSKIALRKIYFTILRISNKTDKINQFYELLRKMLTCAYKPSPYEMTYSINQ